MKKIIQISALPFGCQSPSYQCYGLLYALTEDGKVYWMREGDNKWYECTEESAPLETVEEKPTSTNKQMDAISLLNSVKRDLRDYGGSLSLNVKNAVMSWEAS